MIDVQNEPDLRGIKIRRTEVNGVYLLFLILAAALDANFKEIGV